MMKKTDIFIPILFLYFVLNVSAFASDYTGMWWDTSKQGSGVFLEHLEDTNCICGAWYFYDESGEPIWATFWGSINNNQLVADLYTFTGPFWGTTWDKNQIKASIAGKVTFNFLSDSTVTMNYQLPGASDQFNLVRFSMASCPGWLWWDPEKPGQGVVQFPLDDEPEQERIAFVWYVYDTSGRPVWYTALGAAQDKRLTAYQYSGPPLGQAWNNNLVKQQIVGTIDLINTEAAMFNGQDLTFPRISVGYNIHGFSGELNLEPFFCSSLCN